MGEYTKVSRNNSQLETANKKNTKKAKENTQYGFTEDASLAMAGLDNSSTGFKIPDDMTPDSKK